MPTGVDGPRFYRAGSCRFGRFALVDSVLAHQLWPDKSPIGEHITNDDRVTGPWYTIVGIVGHARASSLESDTNEGFYDFPLAQVPIGWAETSRGAQSSRSPQDLTGDLGAAVRSGPIHPFRFTT